MSAREADEAWAESSDGGSTTSEDLEAKDESAEMQEDDSWRAVDPDLRARADGLKDRGNAALKEGRFVKALEEYTAAIELAPAPAYFTNRAMVYIKREEYGLAILDAESAMRLDRKFVKAYYRRGTAKFALSHYKEAQRDIKFVCRLKPKDKDARLKLKSVQQAIRQEAFARAIEAEQTVPLSERLKLADIKVPESYDGPRLDDAQLEAEDLDPLDIAVPWDFVLAAIERFRSEKLVHKRYLLAILLKVKKILTAHENVMKLALPDVPPEDGGTGSTSASEPRFTVCGDTHGQYYDVLNIFAINGMPHATNPYLFNGDFVDRGSFSVEVISTFLMIKCARPDAIFFTRGNHESKRLNAHYGFEGEAKAKYDDVAMSIFTEVFNSLPLAAVIQSSAFVVHGGLASVPDVTIADIDAIDRFRDLPDSGLMSDILWSDPQPLPGWGPSKRGVGKSFGPDVTAAFLELNDLTVVIRSHEVKEEGYLVEHNGKCITVFSAPNYCDNVGNKGAFITFTQDMVPRFTQFEAVPHPNVRPMAYAAPANMFGL